MRAVRSQRTSIWHVGKSVPFALEASIHTCRRFRVAAPDRSRLTLPFIAYPWSSDDDDGGSSEPRGLTFLLS